MVGTPEGRRAAGPDTEAATEEVREAEGSPPHQPTPTQAPTTREEELAPDPAAEAARIRDLVRRSLHPAGGRSASCGIIARGGMADLERVFDRVLGRAVAVKTIRDEDGESYAAACDFIREAQVTGQLEHPNVVPVHGLGTTSDGRLCITMKLVEGRTLHAVVKGLPSGPLDRATLLDLLDVVLRVCDALAFAHSRGVIHCDVKPANVMVGEFGQVYLMDWGVARLADENVEPGATPVTCTAPSCLDGLVRGTPAWMAPEQARGGVVDARTDVFAVGGLVYSLLCRRAPFRGGDTASSIDLAARGEFPPPSSIARGTPAALERIVLKAMAREPGARHGSIRELKADLQRFVRGGGDFPRLEVPAGAIVVAEGDEGDAAYIIESGLCEVLKDEGGLARVLRRMGPGEVFGETAILAASPRTATVVAVEPTVLRMVTAEVLEQEVGAMKPWMAAFIRTIARRFQERETKG